MNKKKSISRGLEQELGETMISLLIELGRPTVKRCAMGSYCYLLSGRISLLKTGPATFEWTVS
jgi:hypothetical protein